MILGAVLAGGLSTRFGRDKAMAQLDGRTLLARAVDTLGSWCDHVVIVGRERGPAPSITAPFITAPCIPDWPRPQMGPLGGIAAALRQAQDGDFDTVLTCGVDSLNLPADLLQRLSPAPAFLATQPVIGHWQADAAAIVETILRSEGRHSMKAFATAAGARSVDLASAPANINTPADLAALEKY